MTQRLGTFYRWALFLSGASLAVYVPYKYATQLHALEGLYAFLFPLSAVLAAGGMLLAWRPALTFRVPPFFRAAVAVLSGGWIATGLLCIPSLTVHVLASPFGGLFATFHMLVQHVVLSMAVGLLVLAPGKTFALLGWPVPDTRTGAEEGSLVPGDARA